MQAHIRGCEIYFDIDGAGLVSDGDRMRERPTAFLVHGGPGIDHTAGKARYGRLRKRMQLVYFDHRGQGRSGRGNPETYTLDENVEDMEALRRHLGIGPIVSIGSSYGGMVAMAHAARYPGSVSHLILCVTAAHSGYVERAKESVRQRGTEEQIAMCEALFAGQINSPERMRRYFEVMRTLYACKHDPNGGDNSGPMILEPIPLNKAHGPGGFLRTLDLRPELRAITAPTLILAGRHDWIHAPEFSEEIHDLIPGSDLRIFEESRHLLAVDEPRNLLDAIAGFVIYRTRSTGLRSAATRS